MKYSVPFIFTCSLLTACGDDSDGNISVDAGEEITANERQTVTLEGSASFPDGDGSVEWSQVSGPMIEDLEEVDELELTFQIPATNEDSVIVMALTATDSGDSVTDEVSININDQTASPQGINEDIADRRTRARMGRQGRTMVDSREVRTYDGMDNNLDNAEWGASFTHLARWGEVAYEDGISSMAGSDRVSPRVISNALCAQDDGESIPNTFGTSDFLWQWGQFIDHDIGITDGAEEAEDIEVPEGDEFFDPDGTGTVTILFSRAVFDPDTGTDEDNPREQENEITAWIDGSMVYGAEAERAEALREGDDSPYLATSDGDLLPFNTSGQTNANAFGVEDDELFLAGDVRANEQVGLAAMHTLWVREHNRIAAILEEDFPESTANEIFEATRRLVIAKIQMITYQEYLPALIGGDAISEYEGYDDSVNPGLFNEFSVAAYRYGHSLVNETLLRLDADGDEIDDGNIELQDNFFTAPALLTDEDSMDPIFRGMASQLAQTLDSKVISDLRNFLFGQPGAGGFDLVSLNIQRGRDHGVPSYNEVRELMGLDPVESFDDISSDDDIVEALEENFDSVDDIDLWIGGLSEDPMESVGSQLGELFREMHIVQFEALRDGDRFWYENDLTDAEMERVEGTTLAEVIRANTDIDDEIQDAVFFVED